MNREPILRIRDVSVRFGGIVALDRVSFDVGAGEICGLIGPNGAGKTTLFNCLSRLYAPTEGEISFCGVPLLRARPSDIAALGIARTFQNLALFHSLSVRQNVLAGAHAQRRSGFISDALRLPFVRNDEHSLEREIDGLLELLDLQEVANKPVGALPFGTKKRVELARALASRPKLLLLDEPAGGLNHHEVDRLRALIGTIRDELDLAVLLVEHHMNLVMGVSDRVVALDFGRKIAEGTPAEIQHHPAVVHAYLGTAV